MRLAAARTFCAVVGVTPGLLRMASDAVASDTLASRATSFSVGMCTLSLAGQASAPDSFFSGQLTNYKSKRYDLSVEEIQSMFFFDTCNR